ncbi:MAG: M23 family metallopeptidase [Candidatus Jidaibacter sp.]|jgi:murein DD-endopeptidase MepM/ murein hydrolase activator NlpD|nr:M23 family metallopeptidase [Candidatus Jidaibacter sp.]
MVEKRLFRVRFQVFLWIVTIISITLNAYLITSKVSSYTDESESFTCTDDISLNMAGADVSEIPNSQWIKDSDGIISIDVNKSDKLKTLFSSAQINEEIVDKLLESIRNSTYLTQAKAGTRIQIHMDQGNSSGAKAIPKKVVLYLDSHKLETKLNAALNTYETKRIPLPLEWQVKLVSGTINGSLFSSARRAGAEPSVISQLINLFSYDVDFQRDIHSGDHFKIMYEYQTDYRGKIVKNPKILYANVNLRGTQKELYRHTGNASAIEYYDKSGNSIKRSLLKTPINGARVTSNFGLRTHPVLGYSRMHQGLDYGAPKGTPVLAAGDGVVSFAKSLSRGYGKHVQIKHTPSYSTLYAHLSRFASNIHDGSRVKQGQIIGYVGDTGLASGPHLHYEVIVDGKKVNPAKIKAPKFFPLKGADLAKFKDNVRKLEQMVAELDDKKVNAVAFNNLKK